jgi:nucleoside 2-deoxyribosyltransferase
VTYAYVAGPLFTESERQWDERIAVLCEELGCKTFLPHRDAGLEEHGRGAEIYEADLAALRKSDLVVANLDGGDVDAGTAWEIGWAVAKGIPVVGLRTDRRWLEPWAQVNVMVGQSVRIVNSFEELRIMLNAVLLALRVKDGG